MCGSRTQSHVFNRLLQDYGGNRMSQFMYQKRQPSGEPSGRQEQEQTYRNNSKKLH